MSLTLFIGIFCLGYGVLTLSARIFGWNWMFSKKQAIEERFGASTGNLIHLIGYTVVPLAGGVIFLTAHFFGQTTLP